MRWFFYEARRLLKPGCCCCGGGGAGGGSDPQFVRWSLWLDKVLDFKQMVIWDKGPIGMGWHYRRSYETVLVAMKPGEACKSYQDSQQIENIIRTGNRGIKKFIPSKDQHPTEKPTALAAHFIGLHTEANDLVVDPFMGSGSTLQAAKSLRRRAIGIELNEPFCAMAAKRMAQEILL